MDAAPLKLKSLHWHPRLTQAITVPVPVEAVPMASLTVRTINCAAAGVEVVTAASMARAAVVRVKPVVAALE